MAVYTLTCYLACTTCIRDHLVANRMPELSLSIGACCWCSKDRSWQVGLFLFACGNVGSFYAYGECQLGWNGQHYVSRGLASGLEAWARP
jgi:hypothetical protein